MHCISSRYFFLEKNNIVMMYTARKENEKEKSVDRELLKNWFHAVGMKLLFLSKIEKKCEFF